MLRLVSIFSVIWSFVAGLGMLVDEKGYKFKYHIAFALATAMCIFAEIAKKIWG